jgi:hypothetical protein
MLLFGTVFVLLLSYVNNTIDEHCTAVNILLIISPKIKVMSNH